MAGKHSEEGADFLTSQEMQEWLSQEVKDSAKAHELRVKEATAFVTAFANAEISPEEAMRRRLAYDQRWGDALFGATAAKGVSDEAILSSIDAAREQSLNASWTNKPSRKINREDAPRGR